MSPPAPPNADWVRERLELLGFWRPEPVLAVLVDATVAALSGVDVVLVGPSARGLLPTWRLVLQACGYRGDPVAAFSERVWGARLRAGIEEADVVVCRSPILPESWL